MDISPQSVDIAIAALDSKARAGWARVFDLERQLAEMTERAEQYLTQAAAIDMRYSGMQRMATQLADVLSAMVAADYIGWADVAWRATELLSFRASGGDRDAPEWCCGDEKCDKWNTWQHDNPRQPCLEAVFAYRATYWNDQPDDQESNHDVPTP